MSPLSPGNPTSRQNWRGIGRPIVVAVLGDVTLAGLAEAAGVRVCHFVTERRFREAEAGIDPEAFDAAVIGFEPWPQVDGLALARYLRRRRLGTVVVGRAGQHVLLEEWLAVVPPPQDTAVRRTDLQAAIAVAAQETWAIAPMDATACEHSGWEDADEITEEHAFELAGTPLRASVHSSIRRDEQGRASRSTMVQLFGDSGPAGLQAPPIPSPDRPGPTWSTQGTREWEPSGSVLSQLARGAAEDADLKRSQGGHLSESDRVASKPLPPPLPSRSTSILQWTALLLGVVTGLLAMALWLR